MAIFIRITDDALEGKLQRLRAKQPARVGMGPLAEAILRRVVRACQRDPEAWKKIGEPVPPRTSDGSAGGPSIPDRTDQPGASSAVEPETNGEAAESVPPEQPQSGEARVAAS